MNYQRFTGRNAREAMSKVRAALGDDAIIIRNRAIVNGVEILAAADDLLRDAAGAMPPARPAAMPVAGTAAAPSRAAGATPARAASAPGSAPMSTLSFQQYVRKRAEERENGQPGAEAPAALASARNGRQPLEAAPETIADPVLAAIEQQPRAPMQATIHESMRESMQIPARPAAQPNRQASPAPADWHEHAGIDGGTMLHELRQMHDEMGRQLASLAWMNLRHRDPIRTQLLRSMIDCGFSGSLARSLSEAAPIDESAAAAERWQKKRLMQMIRTDGDGAHLLDEGGVYALIGPTGSGKTTTVAKLAAQFALRHGVGSIGLVTLDAYRIGAQDQLRTFGRLLGVRVLVAHDPNSLDGFLHEFRDKKLVLIDTGGLGQRDPRVRDLLSSLSSPMIRKLLVLNAASQAETLEDVLAAYKARDAAGVVLSKIDEAVKLGAVLDCLIRHRLPLAGISDGQRVPEDWHSADAAMLVERAFAAPRIGPFQFDDDQIVDRLRDTVALPALRDTHTAPPAAWAGADDAGAARA